MHYRQIRLGQLGESEPVAFAVSELEKYLPMIDPELIVDIMICDRPDPACGKVLWVGRHDELNADIPAVADPAADDAVSIHVSDSEGYITGSNDSSVVLAVYQFLTRLGCNWVCPGTEGLRIKQQNLDSINVSYTHAAAYRHRGVCIEGQASCRHVLDLIDYMPKIGLNEYMIQFMIPAPFFESWYTHDGNSLVTDHEDLTHATMEGFVRTIEREMRRRGMREQKVGHGWTALAIGMDATGWHRDRVHIIPDGVQQYLAEINGVRGLKNNTPTDTQLCYSQPITRTMIAEQVVKYCRENPHIDMVHVWDADNLFNCCECKNCATKRFSDWWLTVLNEVDRAMTEAGLPNKIVFGTSRDRLWAPQEVTLNNPDRFVMMFAPITRTFDKHYGQCTEGTGTTTEFVLNKNPYPRDLEDNVAYLRQWQKTYKGDSFVYDYHMIWPHANEPGFERLSKQLYLDMTNLDKVGLNGMISCQVTRPHFPTGLPMHVMGAALWDKTCDYDEVANAYYLSAFGEDWQQVRSYLSTISEKVIMMPARNFGDPQRPTGPFCTDYAGLYRLLDEFLPVIRAHADGSRDANMWKYLEYHNEAVRSYLNMYEVWETGNWPEVHKKIDEFNLVMNKIEPAVHRIGDTKSISYVVGRRIQSLHKIDDTTGG